RLLKPATKTAVASTNCSAFVISPQPPQARMQRVSTLKPVTNLFLWCAGMWQVAGCYAAAFCGEHMADGGLWD
ncbi:unnamed protein product, partial [Ceratitis capitata]